MSVFKENLIEILVERGISIPDFCNRAGLGKNQIYGLDLHLPTLKNTIKIVNTLQVSVDYLLGKTDSNNFELLEFVSDRFIAKLEKHILEMKVSKVKFCRDLSISTDAFTRWKNGANPNLETFILIANYFDISVDYLIGRSDDI